MNEASVAIKYRTLIEQLPAGSAIDSATEKAAELGFLKIVSALEITLAETVLRSENMTTALIKIAQINQLNALADEAFRQASILSGDIDKKRYHQMLGFQLRESAKGAETVFINQFANSQGDFKSAISQMFKVSGNVGSNLFGNGIGAIVSYVDLNIKLDQALADKKPPEEAAAIIAEDLISFTTNTVVGLAEVITTAVTTGSLQLARNVTFQLGTGSVPHIIARAGLIGFALSVIFIGGFKIGDLLNKQPWFQQSVADLLDFAVESMTVDSSVEAYPTEHVSIAFLANYLDGDLTSESLSRLVKASSNNYENHEELIRFYNAVTSLVAPQIPLLTVVSNEQQFLNAVVNTLKAAKAGFPQSTFSIKNVSDYDHQSLIQVASTPKGIAYRYALAHLNPFVVIGDENLYDQHNTNGQLNIFDRKTGSGTISEAWIADRVRFLNLKIKLALSDKTAEVVPLTPEYYEDRALGIVIDNRNDSHMLTSRESDRFIFGSSDIDVLQGGSKQDHLYGGSGDDTLIGNDGNDYLEGNAGDDILIGGKGLDVLNGGAGFDTYVYTPGDQQLTLQDSDGSGSILIKTNSGDITLGNALKQWNTDLPIYSDDGGNIFYAGGNELFITTADGGKIIIEDFTSGKLGITLPTDPVGSAVNERIILGDLAYLDTDPGIDGVQTQTDVLGNIKVVQGRKEEKPDTLQGSENADYIISGALNDRVAGKAGDDILEGGSDTDILVGGTGDDLLYADSKANSSAIFNSDNILPGSSRDWLSGGEGDDQLFGSQGSDLLSGGGGHDLLVGGAGHDTILGDDDWQTQSFDWKVTVIDNHYTFTPAVQIPKSGPAGSDVIFGGGGNDMVWAGNGHDSVFGGRGHDQLLGEEGNDFLQGDEGEDILFGGLGEDQLRGGTGNDQLYGGQHNDQLYGNDGDDELQGGDGNDLLEGGAGHDLLIGHRGNDVLRGGAGDDQLQGHEDSDHLEGGQGNDALFGGSGDDILLGGMGDDLLLGDDSDHRAGILNQSAGNDSLQGGQGDDRLFGNEGDDWLRGDTGNDMLNGGIGNDQLNGGQGNDLLNGGEGDDDYFFASGDGFDVITDTQGQNRIHFENGITLTDLCIKANTAGSPDALILQYGDGDIITLKKGLQGGITTLTLNSIDYHYSEVLESALTGSLDYQLTDKSGILYGGRFNDTLKGGGADDEIYGQGGDDWLDGGGGDDQLSGGAGRDSYFLSVGGGTDTVIESGTEINTIRLGQGLERSDLVIEMRGQDMFLHLQGSRDGLILSDHASAQRPWNIQTEDGTVSTLAELMKPVSKVTGSVTALKEQYLDQVKNFYYRILEINGYQRGVEGGYYKTKTQQLGFDHTTHHFHKTIEIETEAIHTNLTAEFRDIQDKNFKTTQELLNSYTRSQRYEPLSLAPLRYVPREDTIGFALTVPKGEQAIPDYIELPPDRDGDVLKMLVGWWVYPAAVTSITESYREYENHLQLLIRDLSGTDSMNKLQVWDHVFNQVDAGGSDDDLNAESSYRIFNYSTGARVVNTDPELIIPGLGPLYLTQAPGNLLNGNRGNDIIRGSWRNDILIGGADNDRLYGGFGNDSYYFFNGDGQDIIFDEGDINDGEDIIVLPETVKLSELQLEWNETLESEHTDALDWGGRVESLHNTLTLSWGTSDRIEIILPLSQTGIDFGIDAIVFGDGSRLGVTQLLSQKNVSPLVVSDPSQRDNVLSSDGVLFGGEGDDILTQIIDTSVEDGRGKRERNGRDDRVGIEGHNRHENLGSDNPGALFMNPALIGGNGRDRLIGSEGNDSLYGGTVFLLDSFEKEDVTSLFILGGLWDAGNSYKGGHGDDTLWVTAGNDRIEFDRGDGIDRILDVLHHPLYSYYTPAGQFIGLGTKTLQQLHRLTEGQNLSAAERKQLQQLKINEDTLYFGSGIRAEDVMVSRGPGFGLQRSDDLWFSLKNSTDKVIFSHWYDSEFNQLSRVEFKDGSVWTGDTLKQLIKERAGSSNLVNLIPDQIVVEDRSYELKINLNQYFTSPENAILEIIVDGREGLPDWLSFHPERGELTTLTPENDQVGDHDITVTATTLSGITFSDSFILTVQNSNDAPILNIPLVDSIIDEGQTFSYTLPVDSIIDIDAGDSLQYHLTLFDAAELPGWLSFSADTATLTGTVPDNAQGHYRFELTATDSSGLDVKTDFTLTVNDVLFGSFGNDRLIGSGQTDRINSGEGDDILLGGGGNDILIGGSGSDWLQGGSGNDTLVLSEDAQWSNRFVAFNAGSPGNLGTGERFSLNGVWRSHDLFDGGDGNDTLQGTDGRDAVFLDDGFSPLPNGNGPRIIGVERFDMGAGDDIVDLTSPNYHYANAWLKGDEGDDVLWGSSGDDRLDGGAGNDRLSGGAGSDSYWFGHNDGNDIINNFHNESNSQDELVFKEGINSRQLWFEHSGNDLLVKLLGTEDSVKVQDWYRGRKHQLDAIRLSDGGVLLNTRVDQLVQAMAAFNPPSSTELELSGPQEQALAIVIASSWQS